MKWLVASRKPSGNRERTGSRYKPRGPPLSDLLPLAKSHLLKVLKCSQTAQPSVPVFNSSSNYNEQSPLLVRCRKYKFGSDYGVKLSCSLPLPSVASWAAVTKGVELCRRLHGRCAPPGFHSACCYRIQAWIPHLCLLVHMLCCMIFSQKP